MKAKTDLRVATFKLAKKRREAAKETAAVTGEQHPAAHSRILMFPGKPKLFVGAPTFSGTVSIQVAPGVHWSTPPESRTLQPTNGSKRGVYVLSGLTDKIHFLRVNEHKAVEEIRLPAPAEAQLRELFGLK